MPGEQVVLAAPGMPALPHFADLCAAAILHGNCAADPVEGPPHAEQHLRACAQPRISDNENIGSQAMEPAYLLETNSGGQADIQHCWKTKPVPITWRKAVVPTEHKTLKRTGVGGSK